MRALLPRRDAQHRNGESRCVRQPVVVGEQRSAQVRGQRDVHGVGKADVGPSTPGVAEQGPDLGDAQRPGQQLIDRGGDLPRGEYSVEVPPAQHSPTLDEEGLWHPRDGVRGHHSAQASSPAGVGSQLDAGLGVDDDRSHASPVRRAWARVSAAVTDGSEGRPT